MIKKVPDVFKNFYFLTSISVLFWLLFFDSNDLIGQIKMRRKMFELENEALYYEEKIKEVEKERASLLTNKEELERFARETYLMKKQTEEVFIIEE